MADNFYIKKTKDSAGFSSAKRNWAWMLGCAVLLLISFSFILPSTGFAGFGKDYVEFGRFGDEKINYYADKDSYLHRASDAAIEQYSNYFGGGNAIVTRMGLEEGFNSAVMYYGSLHYAKKAGLVVSGEEVDDYIYENYVDADGNFAISYWNAMSDAARKTIRERAREEIAVRNLEKAMTDFPVNRADVGYILSRAGEIRNFDVVVVKGDDAAKIADDLFAAVSGGSGFESAAADAGQSALKITGVFGNAGMPSPFSGADLSGDSGKFFSALDSQEGLRGRLFALSEGELHPEVISVSDTEKIIVMALGDSTAEETEVAKARIEGALSYSASASYGQTLLKSSLLKNGFDAAYDKYFT